MLESQLVCRHNWHRLFYVCICSSILVYLLILFPAISEHSLHKDIMYKKTGNGDACIHLYSTYLASTLLSLLSRIWKNSLYTSFPDMLASSWSWLSGRHHCIFEPFDILLLWTTNIWCISSWSWGWEVMCASLGLRAGESGVVKGPMEVTISLPITFIKKGAEGM